MNALSSAEALVFTGLAGPALFFFARHLRKMIFRIFRNFERVQRELLAYFFSSSGYADVVRTRAH